MPPTIMSGANRERQRQSPVETFGGYNCKRVDEAYHLSGGLIHPFMLQQAHHAYIPVGISMLPCFPQDPLMLKAQALIATNSRLIEIKNE